MKKHNLLLSTASALLLLSSSAAFAATVIPGSAEPSRVPAQLAPSEAPKTEGAGEVTSKGGGLKAPRGAEKVKLKLQSVEIEGMSAYNQADIKPLYENMLGKTISLADVYDLANAITAKYRNEGYILTQVVVPPQTIESGHVKFRVVEGVVNDVRIEGATNGSLAKLQPYADKIKAERPFNSKTMERYLLLLNDLPGISAKAVLSPSKVTGATDVVIVVNRKPIDVFVQADNRGSKFLGPFQINNSVRINNPFGNYEAINAQFAVAPIDNELAYGGLHYIQPLGTEGTTLTAGGSISDSNPGFSLEPLDVHGVAQTLDLDVMHPFIRSRNLNLSGTVQFDYLDSKRKDNTGAHSVDDRVSALRAGTTFQAVDRLAGANTLTAQISRGLDIFNASSDTDTNTSRPGAGGKFFKGDAEISRLQRVIPHVDLFVSGTGQWAAEKLLASEQFGVGGVNYGSAYDSSEITGDSGLAMRMEARLNDPFASPLKTTQFYSFYDVGKVFDPGNTVADDRVRSLASAGLGTRLSLDQNFSGSLEWAVPLTREVQTEGNTKPRLFGALTARF